MNILSVIDLSVGCKRKSDVNETLVASRGVLLLTITFLLIYSRDVGYYAPTPALNLGRAAIYPDISYLLPACYKITISMRFEVLLAIFILGSSRVLHRVVCYVTAYPIYLMSGAISPLPHHASMTCTVLSSLDTLLALLLSTCSVRQALRF